MESSRRTAGLRLRHGVLPPVRRPPTPPWSPPAGPQASNSAMESSRRTADTQASDSAMESSRRTADTQASDSAMESSRRTADTQASDSAMESSRRTADTQASDSAMESSRRTADTQASDSAMESSRRSADTQASINTFPNLKVQHIFSMKHWGICILDDYSVHVTEEVRQALLARGYILVCMGGGITGDVQVNNTHLHHFLKAAYRQRESELMIQQLSDSPTKIPSPSRYEMMKMLVDSWESLDVDIVLKENFILKALYGSEELYGQRECVVLHDQHPVDEGSELLDTEDGEMSATLRLGRRFKKCIFNKPNLKLPVRLERWILRRLQYQYTVSYKPGSENPADYMSRHPLPTTYDMHAAEECVRYIVGNAFGSHMTIGAASRAPGWESPTYIFPEEVSWVTRARLPEDHIQLYDGRLDSQASARVPCGCCRPSYHDLALLCRCLEGAELSHLVPVDRCVEADLDAGRMARHTTADSN
ncbi:hypothetical protein Bbelb_318830 [Branchiostoma belcheri]|nr:hypothetical protein Bbelb_318830 [Branchiostoma belcheri]